MARLGAGMWIGPRGPGDLPEGAIFQAQGVAGPVMQAMAARLWGLEDLARGWQGFVDSYAGVDRGTVPNGAEALVARLCLTHAFRRLVLATPQLAPEAFAPDWPGHLARRVFARLYLALSAQAEAHLAARFSNANGGLALETGQSRARLAALAGLIGPG
jgi:phenylacetic acid degradation operon negative regulatory protein